MRLASLSTCSTKHTAAEDNISLVALKVFRGSRGGNRGGARGNSDGRVPLLMAEGGRMNNQIQLVGGAPGAHVLRYYICWPEEPRCFPVLGARRWRKRLGLARGLNEILTFCVDTFVAGKSGWKLQVFERLGTVGNDHLYVFSRLTTL